jgi:hypothetical protein
MTEIAREEKRKKRALLADLRRQIREARAQRKAALSGAKERCRSERLAARERAKALKQRVLEELREAMQTERLRARETCAARLVEARSVSERIHRTRAELEAERAFQREMRRIERGNRQRAQEAHRATAAERRSESDDTVRDSIPSEYLALWEKVKPSIRGSHRMSRTEAFLHYVEEHPDELLATLDDKTDALIRELESRQRQVRDELGDYAPIARPEPEPYEDAFAGL